MSPIETIAVVTAVYAVVFLAHRATQVIDSRSEDAADEVSASTVRGVEEAVTSQVA
jgi:hypothetical protein